MLAHLGHLWKHIVAREKEGKIPSITRRGEGICSGHGPPAKDRAECPGRNACPCISYDTGTFLPKKEA